MLHASAFPRLDDGEITQAGTAHGGLRETVQPLSQLSIIRQPNRSPGRLSCQRLPYPISEHFCRAPALPPIGDLGDVVAGLEDGGYRQQEVGAGFNQVRESRKIGVAILIEPGNVEYVQEYAGVDDDDARQRVQGQSRQPACVRSSFSQARARSFR